jgi:NADH dehydrogenase
MIQTATVISTVGNAPNSAIRALCGTSEIAHEQFRLLTDEFLRVQGQTTVWAAGDCALVPLAGKEGEYCHSSKAAVASAESRKDERPGIRRG